MADTLTVYEGSLADTNEATVATIATGKAFVMQGYRISNSNEEDQTVTLKIGTDTVIIPDHTIPKKDAIQEHDLNIPVLAGKTIKLTASVADDVSFYIYGILIEVS